MANAPETADSAFTWDDFQKGINADLGNVLGNFVNRVTRFCEARFESRVPAAGAPGEREQKLARDIAARLAELTTHHEEMEFRKAAATTRAIWTIGNEYLQDAAPWSAIKRDPDDAAVSVRAGLNLCRLFALIALPFIPDSADTILQALNVETASLRWPSVQDATRADWLDRLPRGAPMAPPPLLFRKIEDADVAAWVEQFGGAA
jgi:methionyl-tRNA synthetase